ncbi:MAG: PhzF family phenazine biosynthesis protein [Actinobacteria bacterium]|nr:PhzF family phenazine biosynthesis protein [Actinomycetota bacterium]
MHRRFQQVDVFTEKPYLGNPVAVVLDGEGLDADAMQRVANWMNLSETTFVVSADHPQADYRVRIFTPAAELPFAGHPTLGTCHAWLSYGGEPQQPDVVVQECGVGLVRVRRARSQLAFAAPPLLRAGPIDDHLLVLIASVLGIHPDDVVDAAWADNGPGWIAVLLRDAGSVLALRPDFGDHRDLFLGVAAPHPEGSPTALEVRTFFPAAGSVREDPATGSFNASVAQWLLETGRLGAPYVASQGTALGRRARIHIEQDDAGTVWVGGNSVTCVSGEVEL